ncbi:hypothetical protein H5410_011776 [Solanum commersonii]|uniref:Uncharacterized protein n=1 Tax=Solanum commersonii TaxID=4109 RepID=A0A9J6APP3_SOLCO|nr:hypothetical protein H5410_011776 [Solanum commersonii]
MLTPYVCMHQLQDNILFFNSFSQLTGNDLVTKFFISSVNSHNTVKSQEQITVVDPDNFTKELLMSFFFFFIANGRLNPALY